MNLMVFKSCSDEELFHLLKDGKQGAYEELYHRYKRPLMAYAMKRVGFHVAEDLMHDLWVRIWEKRDEITINGAVVSYLFSAARNRMIDYLAKSEQAFRYSGEIDDFLESHNGGIAADDRLREKLFMELIAGMLKQYGSRDQQILALRLQGYKNNEIAQKLNLSEKTIRNQYSTILKVLKKKFNGFSVVLLSWLILMLN